MAEPNAIYPDPELSAESAARVVVLHAADPGITTGHADVLDKTIFRAGRWFRWARRTTESACVGIKRAAIYVAEERPVHLVAGVAIAAFVAGSGLRIWRTYHE